MGGADVSLLAQQRYGRPASAYSLQTASQVLLSVILSVDKALLNLRTFAFVALHLFSTAGRHTEEVVELFCLIYILENIHTELKRIITSTHLETTLLYDVLHWWEL